MGHSPIAARYLKCFAAREGEGIKSKFPRVDDNCVDILDCATHALGWFHSLIHPRPTSGEFPLGVMLAQTHHPAKYPLLGKTAS